MGPIAVSILATVCATTVRIEASVTNENRAGVTPIPTSVEPSDTPPPDPTAPEVLPAPESVGIVDFELTPGLALVLEHKRHRLEFAYRPRLLRRFTVGIDQSEAQSDDSVLALHQVDLMHAWQIARDLTWSLDLSSATGELDYAGAVTLLSGLGQRSYTADVIGFSRQSAAGAFTHLLQRNVQLSVFGGAAYSNPDSGGDDASGEFSGPFPSLLEINVGGRFEYSPSRRDTLTAAIESEWFAYDFNLEPTDDADLLQSPLLRVVSQRFGWRREFRRGAIGAGGGVALGLKPGDNSVFPLARLQGELTIARTRGLHFVSTLEGGLEVLPNPATATVDPQAFVTASVRAEIRERLSISASGSFFTITTAEPRDTSDPFLADTFITATLPISYEWSDTITVSGGGRMSIRGPHLDVEPFEFGQLELVGYVGLTATWDKAMR